MKSIKTKLILVFTAIILFLTATLGATTIGVVRKTLTQNAHDELIQTAKEEAKYVLARVQAELKYVETLAQDPLLVSKTAPMSQKVSYYEKEAQRTGFLAFALADKKGDSTVFNAKGETTNVAERDYFQAAMKGIPTVSDVLISSATGEAVVLFAAPVYQNGQIVGVLYGRHDGNTLSEIVSETQFGETGFAYMVNNQGTSVGDRDRELVSSQANFLKMAETDPDMEDLARIMESGMLAGETGSGEYAYKGNDQIVAYTPVEGTPWIMAVGMETAEVLAEVNHLVMVIILLCTLMLLLGLVVVYFVSSRIAKPIRAVTGVAKQISEGNFDVQRFTATKDEVGQLSHAFNLTIDRLVNYQEYIDEISDALFEVSQGNLEVELKREYIGQFKKLKDNMDALLEGLNSTMTQISQSADQVNAGSEQMAYGAQALSQGASEQASAVEELSASISEITTQIQHSAQSAQLVNTKAGSAGKELKNSERQMEEMTAAMERIASKSAEVSNIIKTIDDITFQTNILALNAAIEAARAGAAGKGFAVVADEVRNLAGKSAVAAKDIAVLIDETLTAVREGSDIVERTAATLEETAKTTGEVVALIGEITKGTDEQAISIAQVNQGVEQISMVVQTNAATAEESAATSQELSGQSSLLKDLIAQFRLKQATEQPAALAPDYDGWEEEADAPRYAGAMPGRSDKY